MKGIWKLGKGKKDSFDLDPVSFVSHELKTPLSVLRLNVDILKQKISPGNKDIIRIIDEEVDWMIQFVADTLDLKSDTASSLNLNWYPWNKWIREIKDEIHKKVTFFNRKWRVDLLEKEIDVYMDPFYVRQVMLNLIMNAVEHSPEGGTIEMVCENTEKQGLSVSVKDQGSGIQEEMKNKIFEPFYKGRSQVNKAVKGSGLGLAIVKKITQAHGGYVKASNRSEVKGAVFTFYLPKIK